VDGWFDSEIDALNWQQTHGSLALPKQDPYSKKWCADPEHGLSAFGFNDKKSFIKAMNYISDYVYKENGEIAVFKSENYKLNYGADGEDVFSSGTFLFYINLNTTYEQFLLMIE